MEGSEGANQNITIYLLLLISSILVFVDSLELYHVIMNWQYGTLIITPTFDSCVKWELYSKTAFSIFSLLGAISSLIISAFLIIDVNWFVTKAMTSFLYFNYLIFGPYMLGFAIIGLSNWSNIVYVCDRQNLENKILSPANIFSLLGCLFMSLLITILVAIYKTVDLFMNSILSKPGGEPIIKKIFWWAVFRNREPIDFIRRAQQPTVAMQVAVQFSPNIGPTVNAEEDNRNNV